MFIGVGAVVAKSARPQKVYRLCHAQAIHKDNMHISAKDVIKGEWSMNVRSDRG